MTDEQATSLVSSVERIERALTGDKIMGQTGLIERTENHHSRLKRLEQWGSTVIAAGGIFVVAYKVAVDWWPRK